MREAVLKLTMDYKMTKHMLNNGTLNRSRTRLLVRTWHCYFISFNSEHPVGMLQNAAEARFSFLGGHNIAVLVDRSLSTEHERNIAAHLQVRNT